MNRFCLLILVLIPLSFAECIEVNQSEDLKPNVPISLVLAWCPPCVPVQSLAFISLPIALPRKFA